jgi:hypothetical protein
MFAKPASRRNYSAMTSLLTIKAWQDAMPKFYPDGIARWPPVCYPFDMGVVS